MYIKYWFSIVLVLILSTTTTFAQNKKALLVCISDYPQESGFKQINGANDLEIVSESLIKQGFTIKSLLNSQATANNIRTELDNIVKNSNTNDWIYIHFSTHGQPFEDVAPYDENDGWDESIVAYDAQISYKQGIYEGQNHILDDELTKYFTSIRTRVGSNGFLCVAIDACHSGAISRADYDDDAIARGTNVGFSKQDKKYIPNITNSGNFGDVKRIKTDNNISDILLLEACREYQINFEIEINKKSYGSLSYSIVQTLKQQPLTKSIDWANNTKKLLDYNNENQNMVIETSLQK